MTPTLYPTRRTIALPRLLKGCLIATLALGAALTQARDLRASDIHPGDYPTVEGVRYMGKLIEEKTQGRLKIRLYPNGALGSEKDTLEQMKIGAIDIMRVNAGLMNEVVPETQAVALPFVFRSIPHMRRVLDGPIGEEILGTMAAQGFIGLAFYDSGARSFYTAKKPVRQLADLQHTKIRAPQSDLFVSMIEALGASATPMPYGEVYTGLKTGLVDGAENNGPSFVASRHFEAVKYFTLTEHQMVPEVVAFSKRVWDGLSKEDQAIVRQAAKDSVPYMRKLWDAREEKATATVKAAGVEIITIADKKPFIDAMKPVYSRFSNTPRLQSLVKRIQDAQ